MGRAARNVEGQVIMYADTVTDSMKRAISETTRRRQIQIVYNTEHGIDPQTIRKKVTDILLFAQSDSTPRPRRSRRRREPEALSLPKDELTRLVQSLEEEMKEAARDLKFEYAARLRDEITDLKRELKATVS
jgi:excinuclease ABC subunit B